MINDNVNFCPKCGGELFRTDVDEETWKSFDDAQKAATTSNLMSILDRMENRADTKAQAAPKKSSVKIDKRQGIILALVLFLVIATIGAYHARQKQDYEVTHGSPSASQTETASVPPVSEQEAPETQEAAETSVSAETQEEALETPAEEEAPADFQVHVETPVDEPPREDEYIQTTFGNYIKKPKNLQISQTAVVIEANGDSDYTLLSTTLIVNPEGNPAITNAKLHYTVYGENNKILAEDDWIAGELVFPGDTLPVVIEKYHLTEEPVSMDIRFADDTPFLPIANEELQFCFEKKYNDPRLEIKDLEVVSEYAVLGTLVNKSDMDFKHIDVYVLFFAESGKLIYGSSLDREILRVKMGEEKSIGQRRLSISDLPDYDRVEIIMFENAYDPS